MKIKLFLLHIAIVISSGLLFVNLYNSFVDASNWGNQLPQYIDVVRKYFSSRDPADFFKFAGPLIHIVGINCVIRFWKIDNNVRSYNMTALGLILLHDLITFVFIFPLNEVLFGDTQDIILIQNAIHRWSLLNWLRLFVLVAIPIMYSLSLNKYSQTLLKGIQ